MAHPDTAMSLPAFKMYQLLSPVSLTPGLSIHDPRPRSVMLPLPAAVEVALMKPPFQSMPDPLKLKVVPVSASSTMLPAVLPRLALFWLRICPP